ncbi:MAG: AAA domain-containing protein, partial [Microcoleaceae cyanobacterium]
VFLQEVQEKRKWWQKIWQRIPENIRPAVADSELFNIEFLEGMKTQIQSWQQELEKEQAYLSRYEKVVNKWIGKIRQPSEQDKQELRQIYIDNTNVIGITCSQAAGFAFKEFNSFDVVIIDEVSKCTPPELLMAALKGKKLVLIGDYRQLPPMFNDSTIEEIAEELDRTAEDLNFLRDSLFKVQFETAGDNIKQWLNTQYRMHPVIMGAINQFYDGRLICGLVDHDTERAHKIIGQNIQESHHLIWVKMPAENVYREKKEGTSYYNEKEVEVIDALCQEMEDAWAEKIVNGESKKEVGIITFYGAQLRRIEDMLNNRKFPSLHIRTGTVDRFQGMERAVIIVSLVRNNSEKNVGFAKKPERINVAFSRPQELLVIIGCHSLFTQHSSKVGRMYSEVSKIASLNGGLIDVSQIFS